MSTHGGDTHDDRDVADHRPRQKPELKMDTRRRKLSAWMLRQKTRERIVAAALLGAKHSREVKYSQAYGKRMWGVVHKIHPPSVPPFEDCSSYATWCFWVARAPDPNERGYDGFGYTGTQIINGWEVQAARKADLAFYGSSRTHITHVAIVVEPGDFNTAKVVSHGNDACPCGPIKLKYRSDFQFCRRYIR